MRHTAIAPFPAVLVTLLASGCLGGAPDGPETPEAEETPHGYVEGAEEAAEPQSRLVLADSDSGDVVLLDLITEEISDLGNVPGVDGISGDGRFAYLQSSGNGMSEVFDSGAWTVDHGDHSHYYRTGAGPVGSLDGAIGSDVVTDTALTSLSGADGGSLVLTREGLEDGSVETADVLPDGRTAAYPYKGVLVTVDTADGAVRTLERDGGPGQTLSQTCASPQGAAVTRRGLVLGCEEGTLHLTEDDGSLGAETIPYPGPGRTEAFHHRSGSAVLAALSTDGDPWVLDLAAAEWRSIDLEDTVAVTAVGEDMPFLALTGDGNLHSLDAETGEQEADVPLLDGLDAEHPPTLQVDTSRAYVNDPEAGTVHEIDYNDDLRVARTLDVGIAPHLMVETGR